MKRMQSCMTQRTKTYKTRLAPNGVASISNSILVFLIFWILKFWIPMLMIQNAPLLFFFESQMVRIRLEPSILRHLSRQHVGLVWKSNGQSTGGNDLFETSARIDRQRPIYISSVSSSWLAEWRLRCRLLDCNWRTSAATSSLFSSRVRPGYQVGAHSYFYHVAPLCLLLKFNLIFEYKYIFVSCWPMAAVGGRQSSVR